LNTVVLDGILKGRQASLLFVAVTNVGVVAATALLAGAVLAPVPVPLVELPPLEDAVEAPVEVVPAGGAVVPPEVLLGGVAVPLVVLAAVDPDALAALLEPQALSAARQATEIAGKSETRSFDTKIIATCSHSLTCDHAECR
jgi:hypothetical protein